MGDDAPGEKKKKKKFEIPAIKLKDGVKPGGKVVAPGQATEQATVDVSPTIPTKHGDDAVRMDQLDILQELGRGATGVVELVQCRKTQKKFAMKTLNFPPQLQVEDQKTIQRETRRLKELDCPYLVKTHNADFSEGHRRMRIVMELMDGGALDSVLGDARAHKIEMPDIVIAGVIHGLVHGLEFMHRRAADGSAGGARQIHRDIKPGNTLLNMNGECKIADFGTAKESSTQKQHTMIGTMAYMAPERIQGMPYGPPADMWSVGVSVSEMALGRYPFTPSGPGPLGFLNAVMTFGTVDLVGHSDDMRDFVSALLKQNPAERLTAQDAVKHPFLSATPVETLKAAVIEWLQQIKEAERKAKAAAEAKAAAAAAK